MKKYDVIIVGGGPAGSTAALYLGRYGKKVLVVSRDLGSFGNAGMIENWPGDSQISAMELFQKFQNHAKEYGCEFISGDVLDVKKKTQFVVKVDDDSYSSKSIILANGTVHRKLNISSEDEFVGKGVSYCATCDGMFFKNKDVVVIGGSDSAAKSALYLSDICKNVKIIYRKSCLRCEKIYLDRILGRRNIEIIYNAIPVEIIGKNSVEAIKLKQSNAEKKISCDGIFVEIGTIPDEVLSKCLNLETDDNGYIKVDKNMKTNIGGVFAAGDITDNSLKQIITASADGAIAAYSAKEFCDFDT